ncbi:MAG: hypothetical protein QJR13_09650 [Bacillota bacterium]|nr:hypothetical protein [Bacillota bacterium]
MDEGLIFQQQRRYSRVAARLRAQRLQELRAQTAEEKLLRAIQLYELGRALKEVSKDAPGAPPHGPVL